VLRIITWRKARESNPNGACVEVGQEQPGDGTVLLRDTKSKTSPVLKSSPRAWKEFTDQVKLS
jgi:hypothetical protein